MYLQHPKRAHASAFHKNASNNDARSTVVYVSVCITTWTIISTIIIIWNSRVRRVVELFSFNAGYNNNGCDSSTIVTALTIIIHRAHSASTLSSILCRVSSRKFCACCYCVCVSYNAGLRVS